MSGARQKSSKFYQTFMKEVIKVFKKLFQKMVEEKALPNSFYEVIITLITKPGRDTATKEYYKPIYVMNIDKILKTVLEIKSNDI